MPDQNGIENLGGTLRLGSYPCVLDKKSKAYALYGTELINERHRHRFEINNHYRDDFTSHGMMISGQSPDGHIVEMIELPDHPFYVGIQAHPELKSRPNHAHPLFAGFGAGRTQTCKEASHEEKSSFRAGSAPLSPEDQHGHRKNHDGERPYGHHADP